MEIVCVGTKLNQDPYSLAALWTYKTLVNTRKHSTDLVFEDLFMRGFAVVYSREFATQSRKVLTACTQEGRKDIRIACPLIRVSHVPDAQSAILANDKSRVGLFALNERPNACYNLHFGHAGGQQGFRASLKLRTREAE